MRKQNMKHFQWSLARLLFGLSIFLTIERLDFGRSNIVDIQSFVYILGITAVLSTVLLPQLTRVPLYWLLSFWFVTFLLLKLLVFNERPFLGGIYTYLTLTEAGFSLLLVSLAYRVAMDLRDFRDAVGYISMADMGQYLLKVEDADAKIRQEMMRSRHFHRSLSVVIAEPAGRDLEEVTPRLVKEIQQSVAQYHLAARLAKLIDEHSRFVDTVMEDQENGRFIILCPEIDAQGSSLLTDRIYKAVKNLAGVDLSFGVASFPNEALTFESLVSEAERKLKSQEEHARVDVQVHPQQDMLRASRDFSG